MCPVSYTSILSSSPFFGMPPQSYWWPCCFRRFISKCWFNSEPSMDGQVYPRPRNFFPDNSRPLSGIQLVSLLCPSMNVSRTCTTSPNPSEGEKGCSLFILFYFFRQDTRHFFVSFSREKKLAEREKQQQQNNQELRETRREKEGGVRLTETSEPHACPSLPIFIFCFSSRLVNSSRRLPSPSRRWDLITSPFEGDSTLLLLLLLLFWLPVRERWVASKAQTSNPWRFHGETRQHISVCWLSIERIRAMSNVVVVVFSCYYCARSLSNRSGRCYTRTRTNKDTLKRRIKKWSCASPSKWRIKTDRPADTRNPFIHLLSVSCLFIFWHFQFSHGVRVLGKRKGDNNKKTRRFELFLLFF